MEHYNLLFVEEESPGLKIIQTEAYRSLIKQNPGLIHQNLGDFYSDVPIDGLAEAVFRLLDVEFMGKKLNQDFLVVDLKTFDPKIAQMEREYIIREDDGLRLYVPTFHTAEETNAVQKYTAFGAIFMQYLFSDKQYGSLQASLKKAQDLLE